MSNPALKREQSPVKQKSYTEAQKKALIELGGMTVLIRGRKYHIGDYFDVNTDSGDIRIDSRRGQLSRLDVIAICLSIESQDPTRKYHPLAYNKHEVNRSPLKNKDDYVIFIKVPAN